MYYIIPIQEYERIIKRGKEIQKNTETEQRPPLVSGYAGRRTKLCRTGHEENPET